MKRAAASRIHSVNVSLGRTVGWQGGTVETGIFKEPVSGRVRVGRLNLEGDRQSDLSVHGGTWKAVYTYAAEHYPWWAKKLGRELPPGSFGENLTTEGVDEEDVCVGDEFRAGTARLQAVQPRLPCYKLGIKFGDQGILKTFMASRRWGIYFKVLEVGELKAGDAFERVKREKMRLPVSELVHLTHEAHPDSERLRAALKIEALEPSWREKLVEKLGAR